MPDYAFTLVESNAEYLSGHQRHINQEDRNERRIYVVVLLIVMMAAFFFAANNWLKEAQFAAHGVETWATPEAYHYSFVLGLSANGTVNYNFVANGQKYRDYAGLGPLIGAVQKASNGDIKIRYLSDDPTQSELAGQNHIPYAVFWMIVGAIVAVLVLPALREMVRLQRFESKGTRLRGTISDVKPITQNARVGKKYVVEMLYTLTTPTGKELSGTQKRRRDDLIAQELENLRTLPVVVLYISDTEFTVL